MKLMTAACEAQAEDYLDPDTNGIHCPVQIAGKPLYRSHGPWDHIHRSICGLYISLVIATIVFHCRIGAPALAIYGGAVGHRELTCCLGDFGKQRTISPANAGPDVELSNVAVKVAIAALRSNALRCVIKSPMVVSGAAFRVALS